MAFIKRKKNTLFILNTTQTFEFHPPPLCVAAAGLDHHHGLNPAPSTQHSGIKHMLTVRITTCYFALQTTWISDYFMDLLLPLPHINNIHTC